MEFLANILSLIRPKHKAEPIPTGNFVLSNNLSEPLDVEVDQLSPPKPYHQLSAPMEHYPSKVDDILELIHLHNNPYRKY